MRKQLLIILLFLPILVIGQKIGADVLDFTPKTTTQMNAIINPPLGRVIYNSTTNSVWQFNGSIWVEVGGGGESLTFDSTPTASSTNPVTSGGVKTALDGKQDALVSGTNIKTIDGVSLLGSGDIPISTGGIVAEGTFTATGSGTITVTHGLGYTPSVSRITIVSANTITTAIPNITIANVTSTEIQIRVSNLSDEVTFGWAIIGAGTETPLNGGEVVTLIDTELATTDWKNRIPADNSVTNAKVNASAAIAGTKIAYDPTASGYTATNVQTAIDETAGNIANLNTVTSEPLTFAGAATGSGTLGGSDIILTTPDNSIEASKLEAINTPLDEYAPLFDTTTGGFEWITRPITFHPNSVADIKYITLQTTAEITAAAYDNTVLAIPTDAVDRDYPQIVLSDLTSDLTTGTLKGYWRAPANGSFDTAPNGVWIGLRVPGTAAGINVDINKNGADIATTNLTTDATESSSLTAAIPYVLSSSTFVKGDEFTFDFDGVPTGAKTALITLTVIYND